MDNGKMKVLGIRKISTSVFQEAKKGILRVFQEEKREYYTFFRKQKREYYACFRKQKREYYACFRKKKREYYACFRKQKREYYTFFRMQKKRYILRLHFSIFCLRFFVSNGRGANEKMKVLGLMEISTSVFYETYRKYQFLFFSWYMDYFFGIFCD